MRSSQGVLPNQKVSANDPTKQDTTSPRKKASLESENDDTDGTVIQNLSQTIIVVDTCGKVFTEQKSKTNDDGDNSVPTETIEIDFSKGREPICVVPEGTTLLLRNLKYCHVTM